jgi:hypothetical protein
MSGFTTDSFPSVLGGGIPGAQPLGGLLGGGSTGRTGSSGMEGGAQRGSARQVLRRVMGNTIFPGTPQVITPFRRYFNAGDTAGTFNSASSPLLGRPINQAGSSSLVSRLHAQAGGVQSGESFFTGNQKYVYDGSDYVKFKKLSATNKTYNDSSFGGAGGSTVSMALARVRR